MAVYFSETGSAWITGLFDPALNNEVFVAAITSVEIVAAIERRRRIGSVSATDAATALDQFKSDLQADYQTIEIVESIITSGMTLAETHKLRGYDAVQLAAACAVNTFCIANSLPPVVFVSADSELNAAALSEGLRVEDPSKQSF